jgi:hypothetical protein
MTKKEKFFHNLLIDLHTARWTLNGDMVNAILDNIGGYSYAHTNGNVWDEDDKYDKAYERFVEKHNEIMSGNYSKTTKVYETPKDSKWLKNENDGK